jgi:2-polyprenyl-6-methoxyphenol hydroxylase-like FAD-dependent oxidoreductase
VGAVAVVGGGLVGQMTALMLARRGHQVIVIDDDTDPAPVGSAEDDFTGWRRRRVAQARHGHVFRARVARIMREEAPDVLAVMLDHGIAKAGIDFGDGFEDDFALMARRPVFEAVVRRAVRQENGVEFRAEQRVVELIPGKSGAGITQVAGVRTDLGEVIAVQLVVDCGGRRSAAPAWLRAMQTSMGVDDYQSCDLHYFARHYRLLPNTDLPNTTFPDGARTPYGIFLAMGQDNRTFCLAGAVSKTDPYRASLRDAAKFDRLMHALPRMNVWAAAGTPITDVQLMAGLANRRRSLLREGRPTVHGYLLVGDSSLYTNATFGQGVALGFWQAQALAHRAELIGRDNPALVVNLEEWTNRVLGPWYHAQVNVDTAMIPGLRAGVAGAPMMQGKDPRTALKSMGDQGDTEAAAAFYRIDNLLTDLPQELADRRLHDRVHGFLADIHEGPTGPGPLPRPQFETLLS